MCRPGVGVRGLEGRSRGDSGELSRDADPGNGDMDDPFPPASRLGPLHEEDNLGVHLLPALIVLLWLSDYVKQCSVVLSW